MRYQSKTTTTNRILCCATAFLTLLVLLIVVRAQTDVGTNTILSIEREMVEIEAAEAIGTAELDLPPTLRAVIALTGREYTEEPESSSLKLPHPPEYSSSDSEKSEGALSNGDESALVPPAALDETPADKGTASNNTETATETDSITAPKSSPTAPEPEALEQDGESNRAEAASTKLEQSVFTALSFQARIWNTLAAGTALSNTAAAPKDSGPAPGFVPAEPDDLWGYEAIENNLYTYTNAAGQIEYRAYGIWNGSDAAWFACDADGNVFGILREIPVRWVCADYDKDTPGTYQFTAEFDGYDYDGEPIVTMVTVVSSEPIPPNSIGGKLWLDRNENGIIDRNETGIADYPVQLYAAYNKSTVIETTHTKANGSYRFENLTPGTYVVGISAETIDEIEYLLPLLGIAGDNKFTVTELAEDFFIACSEPVTITADAEAATEKLHAGMRLVAIQPLAGVVVSDAQGFIQAVNDNTTSNIQLAADIVIEYGMTNALGQWNTNYQGPSNPHMTGHPQGIQVGNKSNAGANGSLVIDGQNQYKIIFKWPHTIVENGNFYFPNSSNVTSFTMKNLTWYGSSEVGCYFPASNITQNVQITFDNVTYKGPGMGDIAIYPIYHPQVLFRNCNITMTYRNGSGSSGVDADGYGGSLPSSGAPVNGAIWQDTHSSETVAANFITFEGENTIYKQDSPADGDVDPIFYFYWGGNSSLTIADRSKLIVQDEAGKTKTPAYTTGFIGTHHDTKPVVTVEENAVLEYHHVNGGNGFVNDFNPLGSLILEENASVVFDIKADTKRTTSDAGAFQSYFHLNSIQVGKGANWTYIANYAGSAATASNVMVGANSILVEENATVNIIAKNNTKAESLIALHSSNASISFDRPKNVVLFNSKSNANTYVIKSQYNASLNMKTHAIRSWLQESNATMAGTIAHGSQALLHGNYIASPAPTYQWIPNDAQYTATLGAGTNATITNYTAGLGDIFNLSGTRTLKNINILELRAPVLPMDFVFQKKNESNQALPGVTFALYPQKSNGTGWNMDAAVSCTSDTDGKVQFPALTTGTYLLAEVQTVLGYQLPTGRWEVRVDEIAERIDIVEIPDNDGIYPPAFTTENGRFHLANYQMEQASITVSKTVSGEYADFTRPFAFTIRFQNADGTPFLNGTTLSYTGGIVLNSGATAPPDGAITLDGNGQATFTLTHGQTITFPGIATNNHVQVMESSDSNYEPSFWDNELQAVTSSADTGMCVLIDNRTFAFTNTRLTVIPTGVSTGSTTAWVPLVLFLLLLVGILTVGKRKEVGPNA